jgi:hypothetical protein
MAGIEIEEDYLRDAVVDVSAAESVGVDGLDVTECTVRGSGIALRFSSPFHWRRSPVFVFHHCDPAKEYRVVANGSDLGSWRGSALEKGIPVPFDGGK